MTPFPHKLFEVSKIMGKLTGSVFHRAGQYLVLGTCGNLLIGGEVRSILRDFFFSHIFWVALSTEQYKSLYPGNIGLFTTYRVMFFSDHSADLIEKFHRSNSLSVFVVFNISSVFD